MLGISFDGQWWTSDQAKEGAFFFKCEFHVIESLYHTLPHILFVIPMYTAAVLWNKASDCACFCSLICHILYCDMMLLVPMLIFCLRLIEEADQITLAIWILHFLKNHVVAQVIWQAEMGSITTKLSYFVLVFLNVLNFAYTRCRDGMLVGQCICHDHVSVSLCNCTYWDMFLCNLLLGNLEVCSCTILTMVHMTW